MIMTAFVCISCVKKKKKKKKNCKFSIRLLFSIFPGLTQGGGGGGGGGHSHRRRVQSCDRGQDAVKRSRHFLGGRSLNGQAVCWALSKALLAIKRRDRSFCACAVNRWSRVKSKNPAWSSSQGRFSTVKNLDPDRSSGHGAYGGAPPPPPPCNSRLPLVKT